MKNNKFKIIVNRALLIGGVVLTTITSCSKLEDVSLDKITNGSSISASQLLAAAYGQMYVYPSNRDGFAMNEHPTDELQGPTRGTDWDDNGQWRQLHLQTWGATHDFIVTAWDDFNKGHALANEAIANANGDGKIVAQGKFIRSFFIYQIMDLYGQVPFKENGNLKVLSRTEACNKVIEDLEAAIPLLDAAQTLPSQTMVATKEAAQALLAKVYLNRGVYSATDLKGPYTFASGDMDKVISYCDAIINSGKFSLSSNYFDAFSTKNDLISKELVFNFPYTAGVNPNPSKDSYAGNQRFVYPGLHYSQNPSGWNGFTTLADFYNSFESGDKRKGGDIIDKTQSGLTNGFLIGQQYDKAGNKLTTRQGEPLAFTLDCPLGTANEYQGVRIIKMLPDYANPLSGSNDFGFIRYADILLMKAEALLRKGNAAGGLVLVNQVRASRGVAAFATLTETNLLAERGRELYNEGWRRNDLIRFNKFNDPVINRTTATDASKRLYPIPQKEIEINPLLKQNAGY